DENWRRCRAEEDALGELELESKICQQIIVHRRLTKPISILKKITVASGRAEDSWAAWPRSPSGNRCSVRRRRHKAADHAVSMFTITSCRSHMSILWASTDLQSASANGACSRTWTIWMLPERPRRY